MFDLDASADPPVEAHGSTLLSLSPTDHRAPMSMAARHWSQANRKCANTAPASKTTTSQSATGATSSR